MYDKLPLIHVSGSHMEIGCQIGESRRPQIQHGVENAKILIQKASRSLFRAVLADSSPADAINRILVPKRAAGYNHLIVHASGEMYNIEVSARQFGMIYGEDGFLVHTNFYLDPLMKSLEDEPDELISARVRYYRALRLLKQSD